MTLPRLNTAQSVYLDCARAIVATANGSSMNMARQARLDDIDLMVELHGVRRARFHPPAKPAAVQSMPRTGRRLYHDRPGLLRGGRLR